MHKNRTAKRAVYFLSTDPECESLDIDAKHQTSVHVSLSKLEFFPAIGHVLRPAARVPRAIGAVDGGTERLFDAHPHQWYQYGYPA